MIKKKILLTIFSLTSTLVYGQLCTTAIPEGPKLKPLTQFIDLGVMNYDQPVRKINRDVAEGEVYLKLDEFANSIELNLSPTNSGIWDTTPNGKKIWRLGLKTKATVGYTIVLEPFKLTKGCKLLLYSADNITKLGAYTFRNNSNSNLLALPPIYTDSLILELQMEPFVSDFGSFKLLNLAVEEISEGAQKSTNDKYYGQSAECEVDINCQTDSIVNLQKRAVQRIYFSTKKNTRIRCTGTLLNNTSENGNPLFLTAGHCIKDDYNAQTAVIFFDYESPYCNGPDGTLKSLSGTKLLSRSDNLDFALLEIMEKPPYYFQPLYSGWDASETPADSCFVIHHPEGDVKKISKSTDSLLNGTYNIFDPNTHWLLPIYEFGTTEAGSSGAGLFNKNGALIGNLSGGQAPCSWLIYDYYQKLSHEWQDYISTSEQLKYWLDPTNTGKLQLNNYDPLLGFDQSEEKLTNIETVQLLKDISSEGWGSLSGHNSFGNRIYAEKFQFSGTKYIHSLELNINKATALIDSSKITLHIWEGENHPEKLIYSQDVYLFEIIPSSKNTFLLDSQVVVNKSFFAGFELYYQIPQDTFSVYMAEPFANEDKNTTLTFFQDDWQPLSVNFSSIYTSLDLSPKVLNYIVPAGNNPAEFPFGDISVYPNPSSDFLQILFKTQNHHNVTLKIVNTSGQIIINQIIYEPEPNFRFDISYLPTGVYILQISTNDISKTVKFIRIY